jgi:aspartyl-tRNA(Asn)/glutamyl-tRNA(Gln) amidotransferase subunit C
LLTIDEVRHVAMLARLGLTDDELEVMRTQLGQVLDYIAILQRLDTSGVPPTPQVISLENVARDDEPRSSLPVEALLNNTPVHEGPFVRVPAVFEEFRDAPVAGATDPVKEPPDA